MTNQGVLDQLGLKKVCAQCAIMKQQYGVIKDRMCPMCGSHYDEYGADNKFRAFRWLHQVFADQGLRIGEKHIETFYAMARLKVGTGEATYMECVQAAIKALKAGRMMT